MIRPLADPDLDAALAIAQDAVGPGWAERDDLTPAAGRRAIVAEREGRIVGVATAGLHGAGGLLAHRHPLVRRALADAGVVAGGTLLLLDLAAVAPAERRRGVYAALLADRLDWGRRAGARHAVAFGWTPPDGCHIAPAMARAGFARLNEIPGFFREAPVADHAACPECGHPCACAVVVFARPLAGAGRHDVE